jgi:hypothetical protein
VQYRAVRLAVSYAAGIQRGASEEKHVVYKYSQSLQPLADEASPPRFVPSMPALEAVDVEDAIRSRSTWPLYATDFESSEGMIAHQCTT